jgi:hypothetical protein
MSSPPVLYGRRFKLDPKESLGIPPVSHLIVRSERTPSTSKLTINIVSLGAIILVKNSMKCLYLRSSFTISHELSWLRLQ